VFLTSSLIGEAMKTQENVEPISCNLFPDRGGFSGCSSNEKISNSVLNSIFYSSIKLKSFVKLKRGKKDQSVHEELK